VIEKWKATARYIDFGSRVSFPKCIKGGNSCGGSGAYDFTEGMKELLELVRKKGWMCYIHVTCDKI
jgi:hypothetical protein